MQPVRYRLRYLLQEFDLPQGEVFIGRSADCKVTIEDPLISRRHAKILVSDDQVTFHDLGSKNGCRINGERVEDPVRLRDGDRIRIGVQELVVYRVASEQPVRRQTGNIIQCASCKSPFPEGAQVCPHCGTAPPAARGQTFRCSSCGRRVPADAPLCPRCGKMGVPEDDTFTGLAGEARPAWAFQLLSEVLDKALSLGRLEEAENMLVRFSREVDERAERKEEIEPKVLAGISDCAMRHVEAGGHVRWVRWIFDRHRTLRRLPPSVIVERVLALAETGRKMDLGDLGAFWEACRERGATLSGDEVAAMAALEALRTIQSKS